MASPESNVGRLVRHSTIYAVGNISRQLVGFLMLPIYTRFLAPADYGVVGLLLFSMALLEPFFGARLGEAMVKFYYEETSESRRKAVVSTSYIVTGAISTIVATGAFLLREQLSVVIFGSSQYGLAVGIFSFVFLTQAIEYYGLTFLRIQQKPLLFVYVSLSKLAVQLGLNIWLVVHLELGVIGVVLSGIISSALYAAVLTAYTCRFTGVSFDGLLARRMLLFSWPLWFSGLASLYIFSANRYFIRIFSTMADVGFFELAAKFAAILSLIVWQPFSQFWETERFVQFRRPKGQQVFRSVFEFFSTLMFAGGLGISIFSKPIIEVMSDPSFHKASEVVPWLTFGGLFGFLAMFVTFSFLVTNNTGLIGRYNYVTVAVVTVFNLVLIPPYGFLGAGIAMFLALLLQFLMVHRAARQYFDMNLRLTPLFVMLAVSAGGYYVATFTLDISSFWLDLAWKSLVYLISVAMLLAHLAANEENRKQAMRMANAFLFPILRKLRLLPRAS